MLRGFGVEGSKVKGLWVYEGIGFVRGARVEGLGVKGGIRKFSV